jgi:hypothetical protein
VAYGAPKRGERFVEWSHVTERLVSAEAYLLSTVTPRGQPHAVPIWGCLVEGELYLEAGAPETVKNGNLQSNRSVAVHLDGTNDVVIVSGTAEDVNPDPALGRALAAAIHARTRATTRTTRRSRSSRWRWSNPRCSMRSTMPVALACDAPMARPGSASTAAPRAR